MSYASLGATVKSKYPGQYDDIPDDQLGQKVVAKHPEYQDMVGTDTPTTPSGTNAPNTSQRKSIGGFIHNIGTSAGNFASGLGQSINHPVTTVRTIASLPMGLGEKAAHKLDTAITGRSGKTLPSEQTLNNFLQLYKQRYGGKQNIKDTLYNDPVGVASDVAALLSGAGEGLKAAGTISDVGKLGQAGELSANVASKIDPLQATIRAAGGVRKGAGIVGGRVASGTLGSLTGAGASAIEEAYKGGKEFTQGLRGGTSQESVINKARDALQSIRDTRHNEYLTNFERATGEKSVALTIDPIKQDFQQQLQKFNIGTKKGALDFTHSSIADDAAEQNRIVKIQQKLQHFEANPNELTVRNLDAFKRQLSDFYSPSSNVRAFTTAMKNSANTVLKDVPGYAEATTSYSKYSDLIKKIESELNLKNNSNSQTAANKFLGAIRNDKQLSRKLIGELEKASGSDLTGALAGTLLNPATPQGLIGKLADTGAIYGLLHNPASAATLIPAIAASSPRLVGELTRLLGKTNRGINKVGSMARIGTRSPLVNALATRYNQTTK